MIIFDTSMMRDYITATKNAVDKLDDASADLKKITDHRSWTCPERNTIDTDISNSKKAVKAICDDTKNYCDNVQFALSEFDNHQKTIASWFHDVVEKIKEWVSDIVNPVSDVIGKINLWLNNHFGFVVGGDNEQVSLPPEPYQEVHETEEEKQERIEREIQEEVNTCYSLNPAMYSLWGVSKEEMLSLRRESKDTAEFETKLQERLNGKCRFIEDPPYDSKLWFTIDGKENWGLYERWGNCTWYAFSRYQQIYGAPPSCVSLTGDDPPHAGKIDRMVDPKLFDVVDTADCNYSELTTGLAVAHAGKYMPNNNWHTDLGHVVFVEGVVGNTVYYSDCWDSKCRLTALPIDKFKEDYDTVITAKQGAYNG